MRRIRGTARSRRRARTAAAPSPIISRRRTTSSASFPGKRPRHTGRPKSPFRRYYDEIIFFYLRYNGRNVPRGRLVAFPSLF